MSAFDAYRAGQLQLPDVQLGPMPPHAGPLMRALAEHMRFRMATRLAAGDGGPLPYALSEAVNAGLCSSAAKASRAIEKLVSAGVVVRVRQLPAAPGKRPSANLFSAPAAPQFGAQLELDVDPDGAR